MEKRSIKRLNTNVAFVPKTFDNVEWSRMHKILKEVEIKFEEKRKEITVENEVGKTKIKKRVK